MPVKAKYVVNSKNEPDLGSHEAYIDSDGDLVFATIPIGTHTEVYIADDTVEVNEESKTLPCLFAKIKIWLENKNMISAVKRLYAEGKLHNSWELVYEEYLFSNGIKKLIEYTFTSNVLLGESVTPAYGKSAKILSLSSVEKKNQLFIAESLSKDLIENKSGDLHIEQISQKEEENNLDKTNTATIITEVKTDSAATQNTQTNPDIITQKNKEVSALTEWDLRDKLREACRIKLGKWCWIAYHFPASKELWLEVDGRVNELDYTLVSYSVDENDVITISDPTLVKLTVSIAEVNPTIEKLSIDISARDTTILSLNTKIQSLSTEISNLSPFKEKFEQIEQEKIAQETAAKKETLKNNILQSKQVTQDELETSEEIKNMIENLDENGINRIIAERVIASTATQKHTKKVEVAQTQTQPIVKTNIVDTPEVEVAEQKITHSDFIRAFIG